MLATIAAFAAAGRLNRYTREFDVAMPDTPCSRRRSPLTGCLGIAASPANQLGRSHWTNVVHMKSEMPPAVFVPVQSKDAKDLGVGKSLVASPDLGDPNFAKTVILRFTAMTKVSSD